jgi:hypothetical protein
MRKKKRLMYGSFIEPSASYENAYRSYQKAQLNNMGVDQTIEAGGQALSMFNPVAGAIFQGGKMLGNLVGGFDQYGVANSDASAVAASLFNPTDMWKNGVNAFKEGKILEGVGSLIPGVSGLLGRKRARKQRNEIQQTEAAEKARVEAAIKLDADRAELANFDQSGRPGSTQYFAYGGVRRSKKAMGGNIQPLASGVGVVKGDTHNQDTDGDGQTGVQLPDAEVEHNEVLTDDGKVLSNRVPADEQGNSIANIAEQIAKSPAYRKFKKAADIERAGLEVDYASLEKKTPKNLFGRNTKSRSMEKIRVRFDQLDQADPLNMLFQMQEQMKTEEGIGMDQETTATMAYGGRRKRKKYLGGPYDETQATTFESQGTSSGAGSPTTQSNKGNFMGANSAWLSVLPTLADNVANFQLLKKTPEIPQPNYLKANKLKTEVNIDPALNEMRAGAFSAMKGVERSSSDSSASRATKAGIATGVMDKTNDLLMKKSLQEIDLQNKDLINAQEVHNQNVGIRNNYETSKMLRRNDMLKSVSANWANMVGDYQTGKRDQNMYNLDTERMFIDAIKYKDSGVVSNLIGTTVMQRMVDAGKYAEIEESLKDRPADLERFRKLYKK